jgi:hypothetical protein
MIAILDGKRYNTETAQELGSWSNGLGRSDFNNLSETLYKTPKGAYFLAGSGGAMTHYGESTGNGRIGGSGIIAQTEDEAFEWAQLRLSPEEVEKHFAHLVQEA